MEMWAFLLLVGPSPPRSANMYSGEISICLSNDKLCGPFWMLSWVKGQSEEGNQFGKLFNQIFGIFLLLLFSKGSLKKMCGKWLIKYKNVVRFVHI